MEGLVQQDDQVLVDQKDVLEAQDQKDELAPQVETWEFVSDNFITSFFIDF